VARRAGRAARGAHTSTPRVVRAPAGGAAAAHGARRRTKLRERA
jgi:hypothetical protein